MEQHRVLCGRGTQREDNIRQRFMHRLRCRKDQLGDRRTGCRGTHRRRQGHQRKRCLHRRIPRDRRPVVQDRDQQRHRGLWNGRNQLRRIPVRDQAREQGQLHQEVHHRDRQHDLRRVGRKVRHR